MAMYRGRTSNKTVANAVNDFEYVKQSKYQAKGDNNKTTTITTPTLAKSRRSTSVCMSKPSTTDTYKPAHAARVKRTLQSEQTRARIYHYCELPPIMALFPAPLSSPSTPTEPATSYERRGGRSRRQFRPWRRSTQAPGRNRLKNAV